MGKTNVSNTLDPLIKWSLASEGMGIMERAGLAGLYLSLSAADEWAEKGDLQAMELRRLLIWKLDDRFVELWSQEEDIEVLETLIKWAWQIRDGIYYMPGIHRTQDDRENSFLRVHTHSGLLGTFLQYEGRLGPAVEQKPQPMIVSFDNNDPTKTIAIQHRPIKAGEDIRQKETLKRQKICPFKDKKGEDRNVSLPGWIYPGAAKRFGKDDQDWTGKAQSAFLLLFAPIAFFYMNLPPSKAKKKLRENWCFLIPDIRSLTQLSTLYTHIQARLQTRVNDIKALGLGDAALRLAVAYSGKAMASSVRSPSIYCAVMGMTDYYSSGPTVSKRIRKDVLEFSPSDIAVKRYDRLLYYMPNAAVKIKSEGRKEGDSEGDGDAKATHWIYQPSGRGRIADNLLHGRPWYSDLLVPPKWQIDELEDRRQEHREGISKEHLWFTYLQNQRRGLMDILNDKSMWNDPDEKVFVEIFHQTLRHLLDKENDALARGGSRRLLDRWENRVDTLRRDLMHAKTLTLIRKLLTEILAEGGGGKVLSNNKQTIWRMLNDQKDWQKVRDLALLALGTFTDGRLRNGQTNITGGNNDE